MRLIEICAFVGFIGVLVAYHCKQVAELEESVSELWHHVGDLCLQAEDNLKLAEEVLGEIDTRGQDDPGYEKAVREEWAE